ncbi:MAG: hypothetical protein GXO79_05230 [Chlorobi bacterium]|nr:hypothetical protein [Chlorobiota bacterium]
MKIENKKTASLIRLIYLFVPIFFTALIALTFLFKPTLNYILFTVLLVILILFILISNKIKLYYIMLSDEAKKITLNYLTLSPVENKKRSISIPQKDFIKYKLNTSFYGFKKTIILYRKTPKGTAKYPPVSISSLNKKELLAVERLLKKQMILNSKH